MEILDLKGQKEFSPDRHVYKFLAETPHCSISVVGWERGAVFSAAKCRVHRSSPHITPTVMWANFANYPPYEYPADVLLAQRG